MAQRQTCHFKCHLAPQAPVSSDILIGILPARGLPRETVGAELGLLRHFALLCHQEVEILACTCAPIRDCLQDTEARGLCLAHPARPAGLSLQLLSPAASFLYEQEKQRSKPYPIHFADHDASMILTTQQTLQVYCPLGDRAA